MIPSTPALSPRRFVARINTTLSLIRLSLSIRANNGCINVAWTALGAWPTSSKKQMVGLAAWSSFANIPNGIKSAVCLSRSTHGKPLKSVGSLTTGCNTRHSHPNRRASPSIVPDLPHPGGPATIIGVRTSGAMSLSSTRLSSSFSSCSVLIVNMSAPSQRR